MQLIVRDNQQGPFLSKVIYQATADGTLTATQLAQIKCKAVLMSLKFADKFYNKYKMHLLEQAAHDVIGIVSLGLIALSEQDQQKALQLLMAPEGLIKPFQKGWSMLATVSRKSNGKASLYGEVDEQLLSQISSPPETEEWLGWQAYQQALTEHHRLHAMKLLRQQFYQRQVFDEFEHFSLEEVLAEIVLYRALTGGDKVKEDLRKRLRQITLAEHWFSETYLVMQTEAILCELPSDNAQAIRQDLGQHFVPALLRTLHFCRDYQLLQKADASPEKLDAFEHKHGLQSPLLGWPHYLEL
ncbi:cold adaptation protein AtcC [Alishewanella sp. d11]|uniref:cold adaptation protein AtcC n=1 Tax=Alishewanella sp. d11 TaxID=3414030 RepID=UPI003BF7D950